MNPLLGPYNIYIAPLVREGNRREREEETLRQVLAYLYEEPVEVAHTAKGAPVLPIHLYHNISISHSEHFLAVALTPIGTPVGIDIEEKSDQATRLLERFSSSEERMLMAQLGLKPIELWCAKEALYKAYSDHITGFGKQIVLLGGDDEGYSFALIDDEGLLSVKEVVFAPSLDMGVWCELKGMEPREICIAHTMALVEEKEVGIHYL